MNGAGAGRLPEFCRSELCTVLHGHAVCNGRDRQKRTKFYEPGGRGFKSCRARQISKAWNAKPSPPNRCGTVVGPFIHRSTRRSNDSGTWRGKPSPPSFLWNRVGLLIRTGGLLASNA